MRTINRNGKQKNLVIVFIALCLLLLIAIFLLKYKADENYMTIISADKIACTRMATNNTCFGAIIVADSAGKKIELEITSKTIVFDEAKNVYDGALLYKAQNKPLKAIIELESSKDNQVKKIALLANSKLK